MTDRGKQGSADAVALGQFTSVLRLPDQALAVEYHGCLGGEGSQHTAVLRGQDTAGEGQCHAIADRHVHVRVLGAYERTGRPCAAGAGPRIDVAFAFQQRHGLHIEDLAHLFQERFQARLATQHVARKEGEDLGLGAQPGGLMGAAGGQVHDRGDRDGHADEDHDGDDVLGVRDGELVQRRGEVVVEQQ